MKSSLKKYEGHIAIFLSIPFIWFIGKDIDNIDDLVILTSIYWLSFAYATHADNFDKNFIYCYGAFVMLVMLDLFSKF